MDGFLYLPFWRAGGAEQFTYRTQLYLAPLGQGPVRLGVYLYENGGKAWANKAFGIEIDRHVGEARTDQNGMLDIQLHGGQTVRIEINVVDPEYGTGEVHLIGGNGPVPILARGDLEVFASEPGGGFELSTSEITITGARPVMLQPGQ
jgi:hypothetical protein